MRSIHILYYSPFGVSERIGEKLKGAAERIDPSFAVRLSPLTHAPERKSLSDEGVNADLIMFIFPVRQQSFPLEVARWLSQTEIRATFASSVCVYGKFGPIFPLKKIEYSLRKKGVPTVSSADFFVGNVNKEFNGDVSAFDADAFMRATLHNADVGKQVSFDSPIAPVNDFAPVIESKPVTGNTPITEKATPEEPVKKRRNVSRAKKKFVARRLAYADDSSTPTPVVRYYY